MKTSLKIILLLPAVLFIVTGLRWLVDPASIADDFGFALASGLGRSAQIGDFAAFFLSLGACMLIGVISGHRVWFYPAIMLLLLAASGRLLAWGVHDASFAAGELAVELGVSTLLLVACKYLPEKD